MKWAGIIFCLFGLACTVGVYFSGRLTLEKETKTAQDRIAQEKQRIDEAVASAENSLKALADKLRQEQAKTAKLEQKWEEAKAKKTGIENRLEQLGVHIDGLEKSKETVRDGRRSSLAEISAAQKQIAKTEKAIELLKQGLESVSEKAGM